MAESTSAAIPRVPVLKEPALRRREFLAAGAVGAAGVLAAPLAQADQNAPAEPRVQRYVRLGRTDMKIADISFGSSRMRDPRAVRHAYERGVNYFDSAEGYKGGDSETAIGEALHDVRDEVYLTSKTKAGEDTTAEEMMQALEASLKRLRTDYVDVYFNHAVNDVRRMSNPEWATFTDRAKQQGKIRYSGLSGHGSKLVECIDYSLDNDLLDVVLVAYNFGQDPSFRQRFLTTFDFIALQPELLPTLERAKKQGVGVIAMKTLMGGRANDLSAYEKEGGTFAQAAFRWVLSNPNVDALVISMNDAELIDEYLVASGSRAVARGDLELLGRYAALNGAGFCQIGCGACESSCPAGVEISQVLRTRMYAADYADPTYAREEYAKLSHDASACLGCSGAPCAGACPNGIPISERTRETARTLG